jgi:hypothetical protein
MDKSTVSNTRVTVKNPNPQGKGVVPLLRDWDGLRPVVRGTKGPGEFLRDYCLSSLVLSAEFLFRPVVGRTYYLYVARGSWKLSMVGPREWNGASFGEYFASCTLREDMTWDVAPVEGLADDAAPLANARAFIEAFVDRLGQQDSVTEGLPVYVRELPYYRRLLASALASSLARSVPRDGAGLRRLLQGDVQLLG